MSFETKPTTAMLRIRTVLHPTDFSAHADAALHYAADLARRHDAELHLLHVTPVFGEDPLRGVFEAVVDEAAFYQNLRDEIDERMQALIGAGGADLRVKRVQSRGAAPGEAITAYAASEDADLIVMGTHGRRGLKKLLLGSVAEEVLRQAACPVLTVRDPDLDAERPPLDRVLVPVDFSVHSINALAYAKQLAALYGAALDVLHVIDPVMNEEVQRAGWKNQQTAMEHIEATARERLEWLSGEVRGPAVGDLEHQIRVGYPPVEIAACAEERGADLIVIASHGLSGVERFPLGSVTERLVPIAACPVFVTRPFGRSLLDKSAVATAIPEDS